LATSWIPGVDVVTAGLAEADNLVALAGTGLQIAGDGMQGHWGDALMGAGMLGLQFAGGRVLGKLGGEAEGEAGALTSAERDAEGDVGKDVRTAEGNEPAVCKDDPMDVVSGQMLTDETDLALPGVLPVVLRRAYASGYETGRLFGPGWSSTLDQRISINAAGIHFAGDDGQRLDYPIPAGDEEVLPNRGARWPLLWNRETDEIRVTNPRSGHQWHFGAVHFSSDTGQIRDLTAITDRNDNRISILRDDHGTPIEVNHPAYRIAVETATGAYGQRVTAIRLLDAGQGDTTVKEYRYDERGRLTGVVNSSGLPFTYEWDDCDRITAWVDRASFRYEYHYDGAGRVVRTSGEGGYLSGSFAYDAENQVTTHTNSLGHATTFRYDGLGHVVAVTDPLANTVLTERDSNGRMLSWVDALGAATRFVRDENGNVLRTSGPDGATTAFEYNSRQQITALRSPSGALQRYEYDDRGNLTTATDPTGVVTHFAYALNGALIGQSSSSNATVRYEVDEAGLPVAATNSLGSTTYIARDNFGRIVRVTDPSGAAYHRGWTVEGLPAWRTNADGTRLAWEWNPDGRMSAVTDPQGVTLTFEPGPFGTVRARTGANGERQEFTYDLDLRVTSVTNAAGASWQYKYDAAGRLVRETDFIGRTLSYEHDEAGRLAARTNGLGQRATFDRDAVGRVIRRHTPEGEYRYQHDATGHLISAVGPDSAIGYVRDEAGRLISESIDGRTTSYGYDAHGRRTNRTTPTGATSTWSFDGAGRPESLSAGTGHLAFGFDVTGRETRRAIGGGAWLTQDLDPTGRPTAQRLWAGVGDTDGADGADAQLLLERTWTWRPDNVPLEIGDTLRGSRQYTADWSGRVTAVAAETWSESYAYDAFGNLAAAEASDADTAGSRDTEQTLIRRAGRTVYEHDQAGRLIRRTRRTLDGRRKTWEYSWDSADRLRSVVTPDGTSWRYAYDPLGRRSEKTHIDVDGSVTGHVTFAWDGPRLAEECMTGADGVQSTRTWDYDPGSFKPSAQRTRSWAADADQGQIDEVFHAIVTDVVGTPMELVTSDGRIAWQTTTSLWGRTKATVADPGVDCPLRFPGQYYDAESGLHYNLHRYYDPDTASYLTPDPLGLAAAPNDHAYVTNALAWMDPLGLQCGGFDTSGLAEDNPTPADVISSAQELMDADGEYLYRGITHDHWQYDAAEEGTAVPLGGHRDPVAHSGGNTQSEMTSWSPDLETAQEFSKDSGFGSRPNLVLRVPASAIDPSRMIVAGQRGLDELEIQVLGKVEGCQVSRDGGPFG
jgi:RHS repeat-associated protein